jgi:bifunctional DNA-binding transcriptional regulator/antitoxin component of YhaV-PrlF toxin-antitoxin module
MQADVRRWGNSLAVRLPAGLAESLGIREGDRVRIQVTKVPRGRVDLSGLPKFHDRDLRSEDVDDIVGEAIEANLERKRRSWHAGR